MEAWTHDSAFNLKDHRKRRLGNCLCGCARTCVATHVCVGVFAHKLAHRCKLDVFLYYVTLIYLFVYYEAVVLLNLSSPIG